MYRRQSELGIRVDEERVETICVPIVKQIKNYYDNFLQDTQNS